jgi:teichuronic acid exporter
LKWSGIQTGFSHVFQLSVSLLLAKLLTPEIFGIIGLLNVILIFSQIIVIGGLGTAIIQKKNITDKDINSVFFFNIIVATLIFILLTIGSYWISDFFNIAGLQNYIFFYSFLILLSSLGVVPRALLAKDLNYKKIARIGIFSSIISGVTGVTLAYNNFGVWSIIGQQVIYYTLTSSLYLYSRRWALKIQISLKSIKNIGSFGFKLMFAQLLNASSQSIINIILAKFFPIRDLGIYDRSYKLSNYPSKMIKSIFSNVFISSFSHIQDNPKRMFKYFDKIINFIYLFISPLIFTIYVFSENIIHFLGTDWLPMIPIFKILLIIAIFTPLHTLNLTVLKSRGKGNYFLFLEVVKKILLVVVIFSTFKFGIMGLAVGQVIAIFLEYFINSWYTNKLFNIRWYYQLKVIFANFLPVILVMIIFELILNTNNSFTNDIIFWVTGLSAFLLWALTSRRSELKEMILLVKKVLV